MGESWQPDDELRQRLTEHERGQQPSPELEDRVVAALRAQGSLGLGTAPAGTASIPWRWVAASAASVLLALLIGMRLGAPGAPGPDAGGDVFLLLLHEPAEGYSVPPEEEAALVQEYSAWAGEQARAGRLVSGEKLGAGYRLLTPTEEIPGLPGDDVVSGFFLVRASSLEEAVDIARDCPHLRHGGRIEVRPIEPT